MNEDVISRGSDLIEFVKKLGYIVEHCHSGCASPYRVGIGERAVLIYKYRPSRNHYHNVNTHVYEIDICNENVYTFTVTKNNRVVEWVERWNDDLIPMEKRDAVKGLIENKYIRVKQKQDELEAAKRREEELRKLQRECELKQKKNCILELLGGI